MTRVFTADNITDADIIKLRAELHDDESLTRIRLRSYLRITAVALGRRRPRVGSTRTEARARVAEILNARAKVVRP